MFGKINCTKCGKGINKVYDFCPSCGTSTKRKSDYGMFGKNDLPEIKESFQEIKLPAGFNMIFNSLMKNFDKQFKEINEELMKEMQNKKPNKNGNSIKISISSFGNQPPRINIETDGKNSRQIKEREKKERKELAKIVSNFSEKNMQKLMEYPKIQPATNVKRLSDKIVYEIEIPGVESIEDVSIAKLENSVEIKAVGKDKVYSKMISIGLPIKNHKFSKGKLTLEFGEN